MTIDQAMPTVADAAADQAFRDYANGIGWDPDDPWVGPYVAYEWRKGRPYIAGLLERIAGACVLELGCNVGATAIVLSRLGARVYAVDVDQRLIELGRLNAKRYGIDDIEWRAITAGAELPFDDGRFDIVTCNSVLEYVAPTVLPALLREVDRVLKPGGTLFVTGTSNRIFPKEVHSRRWFANYVPEALDRIFGSRQRGIFPWQVTRPLKGYRNLVKSDGGRRYFAIRKQLGDITMKEVLLRLAAAAARLVGRSAGELLPSFLLVLQKPV